MIWSWFIGTEEWFFVGIESDWWDFMAIPNTVVIIQCEYHGKWQQYLIFRQNWSNGNAKCQEISGDLKLFKNIGNRYRGISPAKQKWIFRAKNWGVATKVGTKPSELDQFEILIKKHVMFNLCLTSQAQDLTIQPNIRENMWVSPKQPDLTRQEYLHRPSLDSTELVVQPF